jgi:hypothetical protein
MTSQDEFVDALKSWSEAQRKADERMLEVFDRGLTRMGGRMDELDEAFRKFPETFKKEFEKILDEKNANP